MWPGHPIVSDYQGLVRHADLGGRASSYTGVYGGVKKRTVGLVRQGLEVRKVKSHLNIEDCRRGSPEWFDVKGNAEADTFAKDAVHDHPEVPAPPRWHLLGQAGLVRRFATYAATALPLWPAVGKGKQHKFAAGPRPPAPGPGGGPASPAAAATPSVAVGLAVALVMEHHGVCLRRPRHEVPICNLARATASGAT